jgi:hypothetical protein
MAGSISRSERNARALYHIRHTIAPVAILSCAFVLRGLGLSQSLVLVVTVRICMWGPPYNAEEDAEEDCEEASVRQLADYSTARLSLCEGW